MGRKEFIRKHDFEVLGAEYVTKNLCSNNGVCGPGGGSWITGQISNTIFDVRSLDKDVPIRKVVYLGNCQRIGVGDYLRAEFFKSTEAPVYSLSDSLIRPPHEYEEREYEESEKTSNLERIDKDGNSLGEVFIIKE